MGVGSIWSIGAQFTGYEGIPSPPADDLGCQVYVLSVDGWSRLEDPRVATTDDPSDDGTIDGPSSQPGKTVTVTGRVVAPSQLSLLAWRDRFTSLLTDGDRYGTMTGREPHLTRYLRVRRGAAAECDPVSAHEATFSAILYAPRPRLLGDPLSATTGPPATSGGLAVPFDVPLAITSTIVTGQVSLTNPGTATGPLSMTLQGPMTGPVITDDRGRVLAFSPLYSLGAAEWAAVNMSGQRVLAQGQADRSQYLTSLGWSRFERGGHTWSLAVQSSGPGAAFTVTATPAWF